MIKTVIDIGHMPSEPGACNSRYDVCEFEFNKNLADIMFNLSQKYFNSFTKKYNINLVKVFRDNYKDLPDKINKENPDIIVSLHANAYNTKVSGSETLYYSGSTKGKKFAEIIQQQIIKVLKLPDRGIKGIKSGDRGSYQLMKTKATCVIAESFFIDNALDLEVADEHICELAVALLRAIKLYSEFLEG